MKSFIGMAFIASSYAMSDKWSACHCSPSPCETHWNGSIEKCFIGETEGEGKGNEHVYMKLKKEDLGEFPKKNGLNGDLWVDNWGMYDGNYGSVVYFDCTGSEDDKKDTQCTRRQTSVSSGRHGGTTHSDTRCYGSGETKKCIKYYNCTYNNSTGCKVKICDGKVENCLDFPLVNYRRGVVSGNVPHSDFWITQALAFCSPADSKES